MSGAGGSALQELWSHGCHVPFSRAKRCEAVSSHPKGSPRCQLQPMRFSQQVMQRGRMLFEGGFGSICKARFSVKKLSSGDIPASSPALPAQGDWLPPNTAEVVGSETPGCRRRRDPLGCHRARCGTAEPGSARPPDWTRPPSIPGELKREENHQGTGITPLMGDVQVQRLRIPYFPNPPSSVGKEPRRRSNTTRN